MTEQLQMIPAEILCSGCKSDRCSGRFNVPRQRADRCGCRARAFCCSDHWSWFVGCAHGHRGELYRSAVAQASVDRLCGIARRGVSVKCLPRNGRGLAPDNPFMTWRSECEMADRGTVRRVTMTTSLIDNSHDNFKAPCTTIFKHKSCTQTTIKFVCWMPPLMKYETAWRRSSQT